MVFFLNCVDIIIPDTEQEGFVSQNPDERQRVNGWGSGPCTEAPVTGRWCRKPRVNQAWNADDSGIYLSVFPLTGGRNWKMEKNNEPIVFEKKRSQNSQQHNATWCNDSPLFWFSSYLPRLYTTRLLYPETVISPGLKSILKTNETNWHLIKQLRSNPLRSQACEHFQSAKVRLTVGIRTLKYHPGHDDGEGVEAARGQWEREVHMHPWRTPRRAWTNFFILENITF